MSARSPHTWAQAASPHAPVAGTDGATAQVPSVVIQTHGLGKVFSPGTQAEVIALRDVDLRIHAGEFVAIIGPSGSGKSTLMNLIGCLDQPSGGQYLCDGIDVATLDAEQRATLRRDKIGFVFQGFNLLPRMSALENVAMPLAYANVPRAQRLQRAQAALEAVGLGARSHHRPNELSGGQQQRVAVAPALIHQPPIVLADEPTGALDTRTGAEILALFKQLQADGHTVVIITHDPDVAAACDRIFVMRDGELHEQDHTPPAPAYAATAAGAPAAASPPASAPASPATPSAPTPSDTPPTPPAAAPGGPA